MGPRIKLGLATLYAHALGGLGMRLPQGWLKRLR